MPVYLLDENLWFPPVEKALDDGLLAAGGDISVERLLLAYSSGIFPWYNEEDIPLWWCPNPRFVLFPEELRVSKSMGQLLKKDAFEFTVNIAFDKVITHCSQVRRKGDPGTWINGDIIDTFIQLHRLGYAHSAEVWEDGELVGGLYGILLGKVFFGESMFSFKSNASKYAFICWVQLLKEKGIQLIDCQIYSEHLDSLGARMIPRGEFMEMLG